MRLRQADRTIIVQILKVKNLNSLINKEMRFLFVQAERTQSLQKPILNKALFILTKSLNIKL